MFCCITSISTILPIHSLNIIKNAQRKEIDAMTDFKNLINNMPILYMQEELITDEKGTPVELIYRNVNSHFEKNFYRKEEVKVRKQVRYSLNPCPSFCISSK